MKKLVFKKTILRNNKHVGKHKDSNPETLISLVFPWKWKEIVENTFLEPPSPSNAPPEATQAADSGGHFSEEG